MRHARIVGWPLVLVLAATPAVAQDPLPAWSGSARCEVQITGPGAYTDQQTHMWTMSGGAPTRSGAFLVYTGTWSVTGSGSFSRTNGTQELRGEWTRRATGVSAPISVVVRASDGHVLIRRGSAQLRVAGAVMGRQIRTEAGKTTSSDIALEAFEWTFPAIDGVDRNGQSVGMSAGTVAGSFGPMQPAGSTVNASCAWSFSRSGPAPALPPPAMRPPARSDR